jgi:hypothetical protein
MTTTHLCTLFDQMTTLSRSSLGVDPEDEAEEGGDEDEYLGEILIDGFVDSGCGPGAAIGCGPLLGELSLEVLCMRGVTPEGRAAHAARSNPLSGLTTT